MFHEAKALNSVLYIANRLKRKDFHKIFKILYFSDREHLTEYGRPITGDIYIAMNDGPVPSKIYDIFKSVRGDSFYKDNGQFSKHFSVIEWDLINPHHEADLDELSASDIECINNALSLYGNLSWDEIKEKSHDYAWRSTAINRPVSYKDILREQGASDEFIDYVKEDMLLQKYFS
jgi:uncharacterized phage-associated protein